MSDYYIYIFNLYIINYLVFTCAGFSTSGFPTRGLSICGFSLCGYSLNLYTYSYVFILTYVRIRVIMHMNFIERWYAMRYSELERMLKKAGCRIDHEGKRHTMWYSPITGELFPVPRHQGQEAKAGTVNNILKAAGLK